MASYGGLEQQLVSPWRHIDSMTPAHHHRPHSFTEICSQLYLPENHYDHDQDDDPSNSSSPFTLSPTSSLSSDLSHSSLFGFDASDEDFVKNENEEHNSYYSARRECGRRSRRNSNGRFPPPIPCIGVSGKLSVSLQKIRQDGRFILVEVMSPCREFIHARRENGSLKLHFVRSESESEKPDDRGSRQAMEA